MKEDKDSRTRRRILEAYVSLVEKKHMHPSRADLMRKGFSRDLLRHYFTNLDILKEAAKDFKPTAFEGIIDETLFTQKDFTKLKDSAKEYKRFVVTTAVTGCYVHEGFLKSIQTYCEKNDAKLLVLPCTDPAAKGGFDLDARVGRENVVLNDLRLNSNLFICSIQLSAKQIDPTTGLGRIGQRNGTFIYASPKQRLRFLSVSNVKWPHAEMTTGAITVPDYTPDKKRPFWYMSHRTAYIATNDHVMGAIIVEIQDDKRFHFRQIQADSNGGFIDLGNFYQGDKITKVNADSLVMGDWHSGETDSSAIRAWKEVCALVRPRKLFVHDGFNGLSINHHEKDRQVRLAKLADGGLLSLQREIEQYSRDIDDMTSWKGVERIVIVKSNHDVFLDRWLEDGRFTKDPHNYSLGVELASKAVKGINPLQYAVEVVGNLRNKKKVQWLGIDEDYKVARIQLGAHGHKGPNGSMGSVAGMELAYGLSVTGHAHTPAILRGAWQVGTSSHLKLSYNEGPSSWVHCSCIVYSNGMRQLINSFDGQWHV
jgi:hypothetical protein